MASHEDPVTLLVLLGPSGIGKKSWMKYIAEMFPDAFHIVRTITTKPPEQWEDRQFFTYITEEEFSLWIDLEENEGAFFWGTYERHEGDVAFRYGFAHKDLLDIPENVCGILTLTSRALFLQLQDAARNNDFLTLGCMRVLTFDPPDGENDVLSKNLRKMGVTDEREIARRGKLAEQLEATTHDLEPMITVRLTGKVASDARQIKDAVSALCRTNEEEDND